MLSSNYFYWWVWSSWKMSIVRMWTKPDCPSQHLFSPHSVCGFVSTSKAAIVWGGLPGENGPEVWSSTLLCLYCLSHINMADKNVSSVITYLKIEDYFKVMDNVKLAFISKRTVWRLKIQYMNSPGKRHFVNFRFSVNLAFAFYTLAS